MDDKVNVIFYPHIGEYGGIERVIIALAEMIKHKNSSTILLCYYDKVGMQKFTDKLSIVELQDHWNPFVKAMRLKNWLKINKALIINTPLFFGDKAGFYAAIAGFNNYVLHYPDPPSLLTKSKQLTNIIKWIGIPREKLANWITYQGVNNAKLCITMTDWNAEELEKTYGRAFDVIYLGGVPTTSLNIHLGRLKSPSLRLFSICRIENSKNIDWILYTMNNLLENVEIKQSFSKIESIIAGKGSQLEELKSKVRELGLQNYVQFLGFLDESQVENEFSKADLFLVPARQGYGLPILEALYRRVPVVINVESRISEILSDNPWVGISENTKESFSEQVFKHIANLKINFPSEVHLENLPTERKWAHEIGVYCSWWK